MSAVLLENPKYSYNLGNVIRACACFGVSRLFWTGSRIDLRGNGAKGRLPREERLSGYRSVEWENVSLDQWSALSSGLVPIAVEARGDFQPLPWFEFPANPLFLFGPEDGSLSGRLTFKSACSYRHSHPFLRQPRSSRLYRALGSREPADSKGWSST